MCVYSMVVDHFQPPIDDWWRKIQVQPQVFTSTQSGPWVSAQFTDAEVAQIRKMLKDFGEATAAAEKVDNLTGQPDCVDPEKARLLDRVEALEAALLALKKPKPRKRRKKAKS